MKTEFGQQPKKPRFFTDTQLEARAFAAGWQFDDARMICGSPASGWFWPGNGGTHCRLCIRSRRAVPLRGYGEHRGFDHDIANCHECGHPIFFEHLEEMEAKMERNKECFDCCLWLGYIRPTEEGDLLVGSALAGPGQSTAERALYKLGPAKRCGPNNGFGGRSFRLQIIGGPIIDTVDLWHLGRVPERFLTRFPANFEFLP